MEYMKIDIDVDEAIFRHPSEFAFSLLCTWFVGAALLYWLRFWQKHDDVMIWKHFPRYWPFVRGIHRSPVNFPRKGQWREALMFSLICARTNGWVNNLDAGDLRRRRAWYDVTVIIKIWCCNIDLVTAGHNHHAMLRLKLKSQKVTLAHNKPFLVHFVQNIMIVFPCEKLIIDWKIEGQQMRFDEILFRGVFHA